jgi:hypothetical protein
MTPERAREVIRQQSHFPYWGNYERFMTPDEIAFTRERFNNHPSGNITFAGIVQRLARSDRFEAPPDFDERDAEIATERLAIWNKRQGPRVGDFVHMLDGTLRRFAHDWGEDIQTTCKRQTLGAKDDACGSFYFFGESMSMSGGLDRAIPKSGLVDTGEFQNGSTWFFHHNQSGASRGVYFTVPCRVFRQVAQ